MKILVLVSAVVGIAVAVSKLRDKRSGDGVWHRLSTA